MILCLDQRTGGGCGAENPDGALTCSQCGRSLRFALTLLDPNTVIGSYCVTRLVGYGGGGAVYEAHDLRDGRRVALKETFDPAGALSFRDEFAALSRLAHPGLPRYDELFDFGANGYLVMEFIDGQSLQDLADRQPGPLPEAEVLEYARQLTAVLSFLHHHMPPLLHRDIKPANVRLTANGRVKLVDFGLLKRAGQQTRKTIRGMGTPAYAPIEQYATDGMHTDPRSDIYGLGATIYRLLSGVEPPAATERAALLPDPLKPLSVLNTTLSPHIDAAITRAMALVQQERFADIESFATALFGPEQLEPRPTVLISTPAVVTARVAEALPEVIANAPAMVALDLLRTVEAHQEGIISLAISADGEAIACGSADDTATVWRTYDGSQISHLVGHQRGVNGLAFTADGAYIATGSIDRTVRFWKVGDGREVKRLDQHHDWVLSLVASPDRATLASGSADGMLWMWVMDDGAAIGSAQSGSGIWSIAWRGDGQWFATGHDNGHIQVRRRSDGWLLRQISAHANIVTGLDWMPDGARLVSVGNDHIGMVWDTNTGEPLVSLDGHTANVTCVLVSFDGGTIVTGCIDGLIRAFRPSDGSLLFEIEAHERGVNKLAWLPDGETLVSAGMDGALRLWSVRRDLGGLRAAPPTTRLE